MAGKKGRLTASGIYQMIKDRGSAIGLPGLHPYQLRHKLSHYWLANGGANAAAGSSRRKVGAKGVTACLIISGPSGPG
jgi:integrase